MSDLLLFSTSGSDYLNHYLFPVLQLGTWGGGLGGTRPPPPPPPPPPHPPGRIFEKCYKYKIFHFVTSLLRQFFESYKDGNDMGRLEVVMRLEILFFFLSLSLFTFLWGQFCKQLTLSCWGVTKGQNSFKQICS